MVARILKELKTLCRNGGRESDLIRDRNPKVLLPDVMRALKELQQKCEEDNGDEAVVK